MFAEASVIPGAVFDLGLGIDVQEGTFLVATLTCESQEKFKQGQNMNIILAEQKQ